MLDSGERMKGEPDKLLLKKLTWGIGTNSAMFLHTFMKFLEKVMVPNSSTLAWKIPWMEEPGRLQSMGSLRVGYD